MRIAFINIHVIADFKTEQEARDYKLKNAHKGWWFGTIDGPSDYGNGNHYTMEIVKPYDKEHQTGY